MPPKKTTSAASAGRAASTAKTAAKSKPAAAKAAKPRSRPSNASNRSSTGAQKNARSSGAREVVEIGSESNDDQQMQDGLASEDEEEEEEQSDDEDVRTTIPPELITRVLHEFFTKDGTRITRDANDAVLKYVDVFVREAIARTAAEREGGFLEVSSCGDCCVGADG